MAWMSTLKSMKAYETIVVRICSSPCDFYERQDLDALIALLGEDAMLHDERPPCPRCDRLNHFMASPGPGTPMRPLLSPDRGPDPVRPAEGWPVWIGDL